MVVFIDERLAYMREQAKPGFCTLSHPPHLPLPQSPPVGNATQFKLKDLRRAAEEAGLPGFVLPFRSISRVREFKALLEWAEEESTRCDITKKVLKLTKGWEEARDHVFKVS